MTPAQVRTMLFLWYSMALIAPPYWHAPATLPARVTALVVTVVLGIVWAVQSGSWLVLRGTRLAWPGVVTLVGLVLAVNSAALTCSLPWRGDDPDNIVAVLQATAA